MGQKVYNDDNLTEAKFRKQVDKIALAYEDEVLKAYAEQKSVVSNKVLTFSELADEWIASIKANLSYNYYIRATSSCERFNDFLKTRNLENQPISEITVRDVQLFFNSFASGYAKAVAVVKMKKDFPKEVNFRKLARDGIITRCSSYGMRRKGNNITTTKYDGSYR